MENTPSQYKPYVFYRYVNDCFSVFYDNESVNEFEKNLNNIHPNIAFTCKRNAIQQLLKFFACSGRQQRT